MIKSANILILLSRVPQFHLDSGAEKPASLSAKEANLPSQSCKALLQYPGAVSRALLLTPKASEHENSFYESKGGPFKCLRFANSPLPG